LAEAEAAAGIIPAECVSAIRAAASADLYDRALLAEEAGRAGNLAIPLVRHLTARVAEHASDAAGYVHWGATSQDIIDTGIVLQFGGASGTLAALGTAGQVVADGLGARLGLEVPNVAWHGHRDRLADLASALGVAAGTLGKIARDISLLAQTEVAEVME